MRPSLRGFSVVMRDEMRDEIEGGGASCLIFRKLTVEGFCLATCRYCSGEWHVLHGNEIGVLFAAWQWRCYRQQHPSADPGTPLCLGWGERWDVLSVRCSPLALTPSLVVTVRGQRK